jgi:hypothetical protein
MVRVEIEGEFIHVRVRVWRDTLTWELRAVAMKVNERFYHKHSSEHSLVSELGLDWDGITGTGSSYCSRFADVL